METLATVEIDLFKSSFEIRFYAIFSILYICFFFF